MNNNKIFKKGGILLVTGGTGSFGKCLVNKVIDSNIDEIRIFSRDEEKQDSMRNNFNNIKLKFYVGDIRDSDSINSVMAGVDYIFHAAALKQVPSCEFFPMEAIKTNIIGFNNLISSALKFNVKKIIALSTDKSVYPINAMGMTKALMEKIALSRSRIQESPKTIICVTRYGNVMGSRGSVIPVFRNLIKNNQELKITNPSMTRFMMTLDDAVNLVLYAFENGRRGEIFVQKSPAANIHTLAQAMCEIYNKKCNYKIIGNRHGEKEHEVLINKEEMSSTQELGNYYKINFDKRDIYYEKFLQEGNNLISDSLEYNSKNTRQLNVKEMISKINEMKIY